MKNKKKKNENSTFQVMRKIRNDWGNVNPVTKVIPNKKKNQKEKHKGRINNYDD